MEHEHSVDAIRKRLGGRPHQSYLRDWVYGGIDGTVTMFAIVSGVVGAHLSSHTILIVGSASLVADGFAMAAGDYLATLSEKVEFQPTEAIERRHIRTYQRESVKRYVRSSECVAFPTT